MEIYWNNFFANEAKLYKQNIIVFLSYSGRILSQVNIPTTQCYVIGKWNLPRDGEVAIEFKRLKIVHSPSRFFWLQLLSSCYVWKKRQNAITKNMDLMQIEKKSKVADGEGGGCAKPKQVLTDQSAGWKDRLRGSPGSCVPPRTYSQSIKIIIPPKHGTIIKHGYAVILDWNRKLSDSNYSYLGFNILRIYKYTIWYAHLHYIYIKY